MVYVISDIHGRYSALVKLLEKVGFSNEDKLIILGDLCDRGNDNLRVLDFVINNKQNVECLIGNHDKYLLQYLSEDTYDFHDWVYNGGYSTYSELECVSDEKKEDIRRFLRGLDYYKIYDNKFVLVHAGTYSVPNMHSIQDYMEAQSIDDLTWARPGNPKYNKCSFNVQFIVGHTPTRNLCHKNEICKVDNTIFIDCGAGHKGILGCLCLDTMEKFYQKI